VVLLFTKIQVLAQTQYHAFDNRDGEGIYQKSQTTLTFPVADVTGTLVDFIVAENVSSPVFSHFSEQLPVGNVTVVSVDTVGNNVVLQFDPVIGFLTPQLCVAGKANQCVTWFVRTQVVDNVNVNTACSVGINVIDTCFKKDPQCGGNDTPVSILTAALFAGVVIFVIAIPLYIVRVRLRNEPHGPVHVAE